MSELVNHLPLFVEVPGANLTEHFLYLAVYMRLCLEKLYEQWIYVELQKLVQFFYVENLNYYYFSRCLTMSAPVMSMSVLRTVIEIQIVAGCLLVFSCPRERMVIRQQSVCAFFGLCQNQMSDNRADVAKHSQAKVVGPGKTVIFRVRAQATSLKASGVTTLLKSIGKSSLNVPVNFPDNKCPPVPKLCNLQSFPTCLHCLSLDICIGRFRPTAPSLRDSANSTVAKKIVLLLQGLGEPKGRCS